LDASGMTQRQVHFPNMSVPRFMFYLLFFELRN
jgi:hypothetical protein